jgi:hypothetical protein
MKYRQRNVRILGKRAVSVGHPALEIGRGRDGKIFREAGLPPT